jgi:hypothetical protein
MKNKFLFFAMMLIITSSVWQTQNTLASENGVVAIKEASKDEKKAKIVTYSLKGAEIPGEGTLLTFDEMSKLITIPDSYSWMSLMVRVPPISLRGMRDRKITENTDEFGVHANSLLHESKALATVVKSESAQLRGELVKETRRVLGEIDRTLCGLVEGTIDSTLSEGKSFTGLQGQVKAINGYVDGLWLEHHGFAGITVRLKLIQSNQRWEQYDTNGEPITDFQIRIVSGDLGGGQTCRTTKAYALAFGREDGSYCILTCPDVMSSPLVDGMREIKLVPFITNLRKEAAAALLLAPPFSLDPRAIHGYKDESGHLVPGRFAPTPDSSVSVSVSVNTNKKGVPQ